MIYLSGKVGNSLAIFDWVNSLISPHSFPILLMLSGA
jgi:hypothetical protein